MVFKLCSKLTRHEPHLTNCYLAVPNPPQPGHRMSGFWTSGYLWYCLLSFLTSNCVLATVACIFCGVLDSTKKTKNVVAISRFRHRPPHPPLYSLYSSTLPEHQTTENQSILRHCYISPLCVSLLTSPLSDISSAGHLRQLSV